MASNRDLLQRYGAAAVADDFATMGYSAPGMAARTAAVRRGVLGHDNFVRMRTGRPDGPPRIKNSRSDGEDRRWSEAIVTYGDGSRWLALTLIAFKDGRVWRERTYFMQPFPAQPSRAHG